MRKAWAKSRQTPVAWKFSSFVHATRPIEYFPRSGSGISYSRFEESDIIDNNPDVNFGGLTEFRALMERIPDQLAPPTPVTPVCRPPPSPTLQDYAGDDPADDVTVADIEPTCPTTCPSSPCQYSDCHGV